MAVRIDPSCPSVSAAIPSYPGESALLREISVGLSSEKAGHVVETRDVSLGTLHATGARSRVGLLSQAISWTTALPIEPGLERTFSTCLGRADYLPAKPFVNQTHHFGLLLTEGPRMTRIEEGINSRGGCRYHACFMCICFIHPHYPRNQRFSIRSSLICERELRAVKHVTVGRSIVSEHRSSMHREAEPRLQVSSQTGFSKNKNSRANFFRRTSRSPISLRGAGILVPDCVGFSLSPGLQR